MLQIETGFYEIILKTEVPFNKAKAWDRLVKWLDKDPKLTTGGYADLQYVRECAKRGVEHQKQLRRKKK
jgi:hypothetical protein